MISTAKKAVITLLISLLIGLSLRIGASTAQDLESMNTPAELLTTKLGKRNPEVAISVESVLQKLREKRGIIFIDVRKRSDFERFRIPGSINIPLFAIKTKAFLRSKSLVIVNEGYNYSQLERECEHLRRSGFRAWLLNGGLNYWREKGAPLHGDGFAQKGLNRIPPRAFFAERDYENWMVIDISAPKQPQAHPLIPQSISIPYLNDEERFILTLEKTLAQEKDKQFLSVLIFSQKGEYYDKIEKAAQKTDLRNVFFLKGGIQAYRNLLGQQALISRAKLNQRKAIKKCAKCP